MNEENVQQPTQAQPGSDLTAPLLPVVQENDLAVVEVPGEVVPPPVSPKKQIKPAVLALGSIGGMLVLCLVMLMILLLLLLPEISAGF